MKLACPSTQGNRRKERKREGEMENPRSRIEVSEIAKGTRNSYAIVESYRYDGGNGLGNATMILLNYRIPCESSATLPAINHPGKERLCLRRRDRFHEPIRALRGERIHGFVSGTALGGPGDSFVERICL